jgi:NTP pyrophosphatase (non-canonical NTP hydrolase)
VEAGVVNALQAECGETARDHGFSRDWEFADYLEVVSEWLTKGGYQTAEMYVDIDKRPPEDLTTEQGRYPAGDLVWVAAQALRNNILCTKLMLIVTELSEGVESLRKNGGAAGALEGKGNLDEELADAIVRILDTGTFIKANLGDALLAKMATNRDRPYMHGDKAM